ncbi:hypothetical protein GTQ40_03700 [Flavobacteriaceae bacterium R38]|nr:hypothetical protein [Flavobacteriaceae bacterium R38]
MFSVYFRHSIYFIELITVIVAIVTYRYYKNSPAKYFLSFLWFVLFVETISKIRWLYFNYYDGIIISFLKRFISEPLLEAKHIWIVNIYGIAAYLIYIVYYYLLSTKKRNKKILFIIGIIFMSFTVLDIVINYDLFNKDYLNIITVVGSITFLLATIIYLGEVFNSNEVLAFHKTLNFWIVVGALMFHLGTAPIFIFAEKLKFSNTAYVYILATFNHILYGSFIIGFILNARQEILKTSNNE